MITLVGPGGVGKTCLALQGADAFAAASSASVFLVGSAAVSETALVMSIIAQTLGLRDSSKPALTRLQIYFTGRQSLLVLDNLEHLIDVCSEIAQLLDQSR